MTALTDLHQPSPAPHFKTFPGISDLFSEFSKYQLCSKCSILLVYSLVLYYMFVNHSHNWRMSFNLSPHTLHISVCSNPQLLSPWRNISPNYSYSVFLHTFFKNTPRSFTPSQYLCLRRFPAKQSLLFLTGAFYLQVLQ